MLSYVSRSVDQTERLGEIVGSALRVGDTVLLRGEMGAGKTTFARGIARGAGCTVSARSPTFIIVAEYPGETPIFHCDLYRISSADAVHELSLEENLSRGALIVEWPDNAFGALPEDALTIELSGCESGNSRAISLRASGEVASLTMSRIGEKVVHGPSRVGDTDLIEILGNCEPADVGD